MKTSLRFLSSFAMALMLTMVVTAGSVFASTSLDMTGSTVYNDTKTTTTAMAISTLKISEQSNTALSEGYFTLTIPSNAKLANIGSYTSDVGAAITRSTSVLGTSSTPKALYILGSGGATDKTGLLFIPGTSGSQHAIMRLWSSGSPLSAMLYSTGSAVGTIEARAWDATLGSAHVARPTPLNSSTKVGQIYYNDTTQETVITLAINPDSSTSAESMYLQGMYLAPASTNTTGNVTVAVANGDAAGAGGAGVSSASKTVMVLVTQPGSISGTASTSTVPSINAGAVAAQPIGKMKLTFVGTPSSTASSTITFTLNNNAKFHTDANTESNLDMSTSTVDAAAINDDFAVDSNGALVWTVANPNSYTTNGEYLVISPSGNKALIDANSITAAGAITCTVTGTGSYAALNQTVKVATAALPGVSISFVDDSTAGVPTLYAGRDAQKLGSSEYLLVGENAPTSLLQGGSITLALSSGAKFQTSASNKVLIASYTNTTYTNTSFAVGEDETTASSASMSISVTSASSSTRGAFTVGKSQSEGWLDLKSATAGDLTMTFGGTAGASGVVTIASVINATTTTALTTPTIVPGSTVVLPDIQIVENKAAALAASYFGLKLPSSYSYDTATTPTVTATDGAGTASTTAVTYNSYDSTNKIVWFKVNTVSNSTAGAYTIKISGMQASVASTASTSDTKLTIGGAASASTGSNFDSSVFGSNYGAKPYSESVTIGSVVSATLPFADTATVSGTSVTQTFIAAGNDIGKVGDIYVFTAGLYYSGSAWTATETAYSTGVTLGTHTITYDVDGLTTGSKIYIGYGVGLSGTGTQMSNNGTLVLAYTTASKTDTGKTAGAQNVEKNVNDDIELYLNITNDDGYDPATDFAYEWLVFGATVGGADAGLFFFTDNASAPAAVVAWDASVDMTTVTYGFDHSSDTFKVTDLNMGTLGLSAGDQFWYGYVYGLTGFDLADTTTWSLENYTFITAK